MGISVSDERSPPALFVRRIPAFCHADRSGKRIVGHGKPRCCGVADSESWSRCSLKKAGKKARVTPSPDK